MALAQEQPQTSIIGQPLRSLQSTLKDAAQRYGTPRCDRYKGAGQALYFGDHEQIVIVFGGGRNVYLFEDGQREGIYNVHEVISIMRLYSLEHALNDVRPLDAVAWFAEQFAPKPFRRADMREYERRFSTSCRWVAALVLAQHQAAVASLARDAFETANDVRYAGIG